MLMAQEILLKKGYMVCTTDGDMVAGENDKVYAFSHLAMDALEQLNVEVPGQKSLQQFAATQLHSHANIHDSFLASQAPDKHAYENWFHSFSNLLTLLPNRPEIKSETKEKLLKNELMRFQMQATYSDSDSKRLDRQGSPIVLDGYGRGIKTGLWQMAKKHCETQLRDHRLPGGLDKKFNLFPASGPFVYTDTPEPATGAQAQTYTPKIFKDICPEINQHDCVYIQALGVQLIKAPDTAEKGPQGGRISSFMGGRGLRTSPSACAAICAREMVRLIDAGHPEEAMKVVTGAIKTSVNPALGNVNLTPNSMLHLKGLDPLESGSPMQREALGTHFRQFFAHAAPDNAPFIVKQNIAVVRNLIDKGDVNELSADMPATFCASLSDSLQRANTALDALSALGDAQPEKRSKEMEKFYQALQGIHHELRFQSDLKGPAPSLEDAFKHLLPENIRANTQVMSAPHGLAMFDQIQQSLAPEDLHSAAYLHGAYYETPALFPGAQQADTVDSAALQDKKVIIMEPHPNNAAESSIVPHDPVKLIDNLFAHGRQQPCTLVMDVTLNHLGDQQIIDTIAAAKPHIEDGKLNLILLQSGTKFIQNGMDLVNIGVAAIINNQQGKWQSFNANMQQNAQSVPADDRGYIANMLSKNGPQLKSYLDQVRGNTATLRADLASKLTTGGNNAYELCANSDPSTVYIALKPKDSFIAAKLNKSETEITHADRSKVNQDLYKEKFLPAFGDLANVDRSSFGFNLSNFGECDTTVRVTLGVEDKAMLEHYANRIAAVGQQAFQA